MHKNLMRAVAMTAILVGVAAASAAASPQQSIPGCVVAPRITSATVLNGFVVKLTWTGVCGPTAKVKEKGAGCGQPVAGCNTYYFLPNIGTGTFGDRQVPGVHTFRVCDVSGYGDACSAPVVLVTHWPD